MVKQIQIEQGWKEALSTEFSKPYMKTLREFLAGEKKNRKLIYPQGKNIFYAFNQTPLDKVRVVILGQDPYHGAGQAHGLCFSVLPGVPIPPSLQNIYKELANDVGFQPVSHGYLAHWAKQGILLLNSVLTVEHGQAASHQGKGWERFTDEVIKVLNEQQRPIIFVLWGAYAQKKGSCIDTTRHVILKSTHPSPLSAHRGFLGCGHFSKINQTLERWGEPPIDWQLPAEITE